MDILVCPFDIWNVACRVNIAKRPAKAKAQMINAFVFAGRLVIVKCLPCMLYSRSFVNPTDADRRAT